MSLVLPVVSSTLGPTFATWINTALATIEEHDHTTGKGIKVPSAALNLNADVPLSGYSLYDAKSYRVRDAVSELTGADWARGLHAVGDDLWWCNGSGKAVQITSGTSIVGTSGSITGLSSPASAVYTAGTGTCTWVQNANRAMTQDAGRVKIRDESVTDGTAKAAILSAPEGLAADYTLTLPGALPGSGTKFLRVDSDGLVTDTVDADASSLEVSGANLRVKAGGVTQAMLAAARNQQISAVASFTTTSVTAVDAIGFSVSITTNGRPVWVGLMPAPNPAGGAFAYLRTPISGSLRMWLVRDSTTIALQQCDGGTADRPVSFFVVDVVAAGTYTYKLQIASSGGIYIAGLVYSSIAAWEL